MAFNEFSKSAVTVTGPVVFTHCFFCLSADAGSCSLLAMIKFLYYLSTIMFLLWVFHSFFVFFSISRCQFNHCCWSHGLAWWHPSLSESLMGALWLYQMFWNIFPVDAVSGKTSNAWHGLRVPLLPVSPEKEVIFSAYFLLLRTKLLSNTEVPPVPHCTHQAAVYQSTYRFLQNTFLHLCLVHSWAIGLGCICRKAGLSTIIT